MMRSIGNSRPAWRMVNVESRIHYLGLGHTGWDQRGPGRENAIPPTLSSWQQGRELLPTFRAGVVQRSIHLVDEGQGLETICTHAPIDNSLFRHPRFLLDL